MQPLKMTVSLPGHLYLAQRPTDLLRMTADPSPGASERHHKLQFELEVLHLRETVKELMATTAVMVTVTKSTTSPVKTRLLKTQSVDYRKPMGVLPMTLNDRNSIGRTSLCLPHKDDGVAASALRRTQSEEVIGGSQREDFLISLLKFRWVKLSSCTNLLSMYLTCMSWLKGLSR